MKREKWIITRNGMRVSKLFSSKSEAEAEADRRKQREQEYVGRGLLTQENATSAVWKAIKWVDPYCKKGQNVRKNI